MFRSVLDYGVLCCYCHCYYCRRYSCQFHRYYCHCYFVVIIIVTIFSLCCYCYCHCRCYVVSFLLSVKLSLSLSLSLLHRIIVVTTMVVIWSRASWSMVIRLLLVIDVTVHGHRYDHCIVMLICNSGHGHLVWLPYCYGHCHGRWYGRCHECCYGRCYGHCHGHCFVVASAS